MPLPTQREAEWKDSSAEKIARRQPSCRPLKTEKEVAGAEQQSAASAARDAGAAAVKRTGQERPESAAAGDTLRSQALEQFQRAAAAAVTGQEQPRTICQTGKVLLMT